MLMPRFFFSFSFGIIQRSADQQQKMKSKRHLRKKKRKGSSMTTANHRVNTGKHVCTSADVWTGGKDKGRRSL